MSFLHDIWNPWHGCVKCSEGCQNCYMYFLDRMRDQNGAEIYKTKSGFSYPLQKDRTGHYKIQSGEQIRVCMTSDFFLEEADPWRVEAWDIMRQRSDVVFFLLTKRPQRVRECLPPDWGSGWDNIFFNVTCENQRRADERIPILFDLPFKHKGIMCAPFIGPVSIRQYLTAGLIFYPGGKVENTAYAPLLHDLAEDGILCVLVKMPCNLAVLDMNAADSIPERFSEVTDWYIGGHSLGGAMAASYAAKHTDELDGLVLLAAYSTADLTDSGLRVYAAYGSEDGVLNREKYEADRINLPQDTTEMVIDGGCHAGFGSYGAQKGDGAPVISAEEQQQQTADALAAWMNLQ